MLSRVLILFLALFLAAAPHTAPAQTRTVPGSQEQLQLSFAPVVKQIAPSVVNIYTKRTVARRFANPFFDDPFFNRFFGNRGFGSQMRKQVESSLGSGVIIDEDGLVVTNAHVVKGAQEITIALNDGREFAADILIRDEPSDLALLRMQDPPANLPYATLRPSESLQVGDIVLAIGNPFGVGQTVTSGIVSAQGRSSLNINDFNFFIQTDAAINPGNSGGPLVTLDGKVVGINTAIFSRDGGSLGIGFAVPAEMVNSILTAAETGEEMGEQARIIRPWLGLTGQSVTAEIAESLGIETPRGVLIAKLHPESPLARVGIKVGDVVLELNGQRIRDAGEMKYRMATVPLGDKAQIKILRRGKEWDYQIKAIAPPDKPDREQKTLQGEHPLNGVTIANLNPAVALEIGMSAVTEEEGVVIMATPARSRFRLVQPGDILLEINGRAIEDTKDVERALDDSSPEGWVFILNRGGQTRRVVLR